MEDAVLCHKTHSQKTQNAEGCETTSAEKSGVNVEPTRWRCRDCNGWRVRLYNAMTKNLDAAKSSELKGYMATGDAAKAEMKEKFKDLLATDLPAALETFVEEVFILMLPTTNVWACCLRGFARVCGCVARVFCLWA